jgi:Cof subfamily protein (haloacid dehalogenase superfamily)
LNPRPATTRRPTIPPFRPLSGPDLRPRLLALDIDGTLLDASGQLRDVIAGAVRHVAASGVHVVLATGRSPWHGVRRIAEDLGLRGTQLTMQGALAVDPVSGQIARACPLPAEVVRDALAFAEELGLDPVVATLWGHRVLRLPTGVDFLAKASQAGVLRLFRRADDLDDETPMRVYLPTDPVEHLRIRQLARRRFLGRAAVVWSDRRGIELLAHGVNKGEAVTWLAGELGIDPGAVAAAGDAENDTELLRVAGRSAAMGSAPGVVRDAAELVVPSSEEDGLLDALAAFFPHLVEVIGRGGRQASAGTWRNQRYPTAAAIAPSTGPTR